jgi:hypothetical protein
MKPAKIDLLNVFLFMLLLALFYPGLVVARQASLMGDHWEQHFPWAFVMADSLRHGQWPFWTPLIQCGFPIAAESQMAVFYLPNLILYAILPIRWAYAYMNLVHFFISGAGTYFYARKIGLKPAAAGVSAIVFVFGTGYGGAWYNITSLKTLAWFPWILWGFENFLDKSRKRYLLLMAGFMGCAIVAGYLQVAALMLAICGIFFLLRIFIFGAPQTTWIQRLKSAGMVLVPFGGAVLLSLPQLLLSFELAMFSNRINLTEDYAYVGSMAPPVLLTLIFPKLQGLFRGNCLYAGILPLYFVMAAYFTRNRELRRSLWLWTSLTVISLFLALGGWSPLYIAMIKLSHFYAFRIPAKFLIFFCFGLAVLAGLGTHVWTEELVKAKDRLHALNRFYLKFAAGMIVVWGSVYFFVTMGKAPLLRLGEWVVTQFIYGKTGHPRSLDEYFSTVNGLADGARDLLALSNPWQLWALALILTSCLWVMVSGRVVGRARNTKICLIAAIVVSLADLYVFSGQDIIKDFATYQHVMKPNAATSVLVAEKDAGKLARLYGYRKSIEGLPMVPSVNMLYGIEDIGGYSPFIMGRYFETIGQFGNVNDSNRMMDPEPSFVLERLPLLDALDVSHILSTRVLQHPSLEPVIYDPVTKHYVYRNRDAHSRGYFISGEPVFLDWHRLKQTLMAPGFDPRRTLLLEPSEKTRFSGLQLTPDAVALKIVRRQHGNDRETWEIETTGPGFFVLTNSHYPGWKASVDGVAAPLIKAYGLFQAVAISGGGNHVIKFSYSPFDGLLGRMIIRGEKPYAQ